MSAATLRSSIRLVTARRRSDPTRPATQVTLHRAHPVQSRDRRIYPMAHASAYQADRTVSRTFNHELRLRMSSFSRGGRALPSLVDVLQHRAADLGSKSAFTFLSGDGAPSSSSSFADLDRRARAIAVALLEQAQCGDRVLLLLPPGPDYIASFFGAMYAGMIAVPAYPPDRARLGRSLPRLLTILRDADCAVICTAESVGSADRAAFADAGATRVRFLATDSVTDDRADSWRRPTLTPDTIAFLQYTSGSTGDPKGVVLTHGNLSAGSSVIQQSMGTDENHLGVSWLPPFHDMGLVGGVLQPVWTGASSIQMAPLTFLRDPKIWLSAISGQERVVSGGPNFALDWCVRRTSAEQRAALDLRVGKSHSAERNKFAPTPCVGSSRHFHLPASRPTRCFRVTGSPRQPSW